MLILLQLINVLLLTSIGSTDAEKLFHSRDHSDLQIPSSHQAELITDKDNAEVKLFFSLSLSPSDQYFIRCKCDVQLFNIWQIILSGRLYIHKVRDADVVVHNC